MLCLLSSYLRCWAEAVMMLHGNGAVAVSGMADHYGLLFQACVSDRRRVLLWLHLVKNRWTGGENANSQTTIILLSWTCWNSEKRPENQHQNVLWHQRRSKMHLLLWNSKSKTAKSLCDPPKSFLIFEVKSEWVVDGKPDLDGSVSQSEQMQKHLYLILI